MARTDRDFEALLAYVEEELDFATSHYTDAYLDRRVSARQRRTDADSYAEYHDLLREDREEQAALLDALSINVTGFFRNPEMWERLRVVLRDLAADHRRLRLWSAPCADGREPYSLAMLVLDDPDIDARNVEITATDISEDALDAAREGVYETTATTDIAEELAPIDGAEQYVDRDGDRFAVRESVRDLVTFRRHDLINGEPLGPFHAVLCRNLFIYIDPEYKAPILDTVGQSLVEGGVLVVGMTESLTDEKQSRFEPVEKSVRIHRKIG